jgi:hypothetical protein
MAGQGPPYGAHFDWRVCTRRAQWRLRRWHQSTAIVPMSVDPHAITAADAFAYDRVNLNRRPVFALAQSLSDIGGGRWRIERRWYAAGRDALCEERATWDCGHGLREVDTTAPSLQEHVSAQWDGRAFATTLSSRRTGQQPRHRMLAPPCEALTLATAPLAIAAAWPQLQAGEVLRRSYLILKVQRYAEVSLRMLHGEPETAVVEVRPTAWPLRLLFGSTRYVFAIEGLRLLRVDGLLDPRDLRRNGRWREYLGEIVFERPTSFAAFAASAAQFGRNSQETT